MTTDNRTNEDLRSRLSQAQRQRDEEREAKQGNVRALNAALTERDAALAAIERVKETLSLHNPNGRLVKEVLAALDGAPEPEWEYGVWNERWAMYPHQERPYPSLAEAQQEASRFPSRRHVVRRRKAGTWEPVGGEG